LLRADLHIHTEYSMDCRMTFAQIISRCQERNIGCIAVTDHGTAEGALKMQAIAPLKIIVGQEVLTTSGEVMGLFLKETVPNNLSVDDTVALIRAQSALVALPHPFDRLRTSPLNSQKPRDLLPKVDILEAFNARDVLQNNRSRIQRLAQEYGLCTSAGSDAHTPEEVGRAYVEMPEFETPEEFLRSLAQGKIGGRRSSPTVHLSTTLMHLFKDRKLFHTW
jgi:predicted metal-dependent phosphoesterase TrpH